MRPTSIELDDRTYAWAAATLRLGMIAGFVAMGLGFVWWLAVGSPSGAQAAKVLPLERVPAELLALNPLALLNLGVLLLLATPVVTLVAQIITFAAARNWLYLGICLLIGAIILFSLAVSLHWLF